MGQVAANTLLSLIRNEIPHPQPDTITVYPRLVVRKSTGHSMPQTEAAGQAADAPPPAVRTIESAG
jgi:hypothetical protein